MITPNTPRHQILHQLRMDTSPLAQLKQRAHGYIPSPHRYIAPHEGCFEDLHERLVEAELAFAEVDAFAMEGPIEAPQPEETVWDFMAETFKPREDFCPVMGPLDANGNPLEQLEPNHADPLSASLDNHVNPLEQLEPYYFNHSLDHDNQDSGLELFEFCDPLLWMMP